MTTMKLGGIAPADRWGPFVPGLDPAELRARLRSLRAIARLLAGPRADKLADRLREAEHDPAELVPALAELGRLASLDRRKILSSYAALTRPVASTRGTRRSARSFFRVTPRSPVRTPHVPSRVFRLGHGVRRVFCEGTGQFAAA